MFIKQPIRSMLYKSKTSTTQNKMSI